MNSFQWLLTLRPEQLALMLPMVVVVCIAIVGLILGIAKVVLQHRERMAMIERGMHPDLVNPEEDA